VSLVEYTPSEPAVADTDEVLVRRHVRRKTAANGHGG
jgi:hypothetical protein